MKTKTIPFDLETAKKIQAGEIEGSIKTRDGNKVRILCTDVRSNYPIVAAVTINNSGVEYTEAYTANGYNGSCHPVPDLHDLVLEVPDNEPQFKPFDRVLVRNEDSERWQTSHFSHITIFDCVLCYVAGNIRWKQCIPYEGNEHLLGTTNEPKEE